MLRKIALALCIAAGTAFVVQPALFAGDQKPAAKPVKKDPLDDKIKQAEELSAKASLKGKVELAAAYTAEVAAYTKLKEAKAGADQVAIANANTELDKAKSAVESARSKPATKKQEKSK